MRPPGRFSIEPADDAEDFDAFTLDNAETAALSTLAPWHRETALDFAAVTFAAAAILAGIGFAGDHLIRSVIAASPAAESHAAATADPVTLSPLVNPVPAAADPAETADISPAAESGPAPVNIIPDRNVLLAPHEVMALQTLLSGRNFDVGEIDGRMGAKTRAAMADYARQHSLPAGLTPREILNQLVR